MVDLIICIRVSLGQDTGFVMSGGERACRCSYVYATVCAMLLTLLVAGGVVLQLFYRSPHTETSCMGCSHDQLQHNEESGPEGGGDQLDWSRDVFISVKTSSRFHRQRLQPILSTWFTKAKNQTWFFTDADDPELSRKTNGHVINTKCPPTHHRSALCCKMAAEYDAFMMSTKKWFCHFDDDNYVNTDQLSSLLSRYDSRQLWYLGKNSIKNPIEIFDRNKRKEPVSFWFGTGGAGFCISRALALKMAPLARGGGFMRIGQRIRLPDDVTMGYIIEHLLKTRLTVINEFHSHLEQMRFVRPEEIDQQISFSYSGSGPERNIINLSIFPDQQDPTRFYAIHCSLYPEAEICRARGDSA